MLPIEQLFMQSVWLHKAYVLFCSTFMQKRKRTYSDFQLVSAVCMVLALLWLTVSAPFIYACQQELMKDCKISQVNPLVDNEDDTSGAMSNSTEEKSPNTSSFSEEYLHDQHAADYLFTIALQYHKFENAGTYIAYHGEVQVPPPNSIS